MTTLKPFPTNIALNKAEGYLEITWNIENRVCRYPLSQLREACPCVECRGGHQNMGAAHDPDNILRLIPKRSYAVKDLQLIGNYAIQPTWDDEHHTGLYTWEYLWKLYPHENLSPDK